MPSGGGAQTSTVNQSNLPEYARPYYESLMDRGLKESESKYQPYKGDRIADQSTATKTGLNMAGQYAQSGSPLYGQAANTISKNSLAAQNMAGYKAGNITNSYNGPVGGAYTGSNIQSQQLGFGQGGIDKVGTGTFNATAAQQYMSPYMDAVVNKAQADAVQNAAEAQSTRNLQAARSGSFGGSRAAVQNSIANNALQSNMTDIMVKGQQSAFENAQNQFNADQGRSLQANLANQSTGLNMGTANQQAALAAAQANEASRQYGFGANQQAYQTAAQMGMDAQRMNEANRQSAIGLNQQSLGLSNQGAMNLTNIQGLQDSAMQDRIKAQLGIGQTQEEYTQKGLDQSYNDFVNQRDSERQNLQFLSSLLQGVPVSANSDITTSQGSNNLQGVLGSLGGLQSLYSLGQK